MAENKVCCMPVFDNEPEKSLVDIISFGDLSAIYKNREVSGEAMENL
ncbi:hypothetical protein [Nitrosomonas communis]|nr:hypothetical protein [Nitrosomonas communis]